MIRPLNNYVQIEPQAKEDFISSSDTTYNEVGIVIEVADNVPCVNKGDVVYFDSWMASKFPDGKGGYYQKSGCKNNYLHKFHILAQPREGLLERCERCGLQMFFPHDTPSWKYMEYHIRQALQVNDPLFLREYPNSLKS
jgi:hypothetical protein